MNELTEEEKALFYTKAANAETEQDIIEAAAEVKGNAEPLADCMFLLAKQKGIEITATLEQYRATTTKAREKAETARQKKEVIDKGKQIKSHIDTLTTILKTDPLTSDQVQNTLTTIAALTANMRTPQSERSRIATFAAYLENIKNYDESKLFVPKLFGDIQFQNATVSYIGARTSRGKTTAMTNLAREAIETGRNVLFLSLEESPQDILDKIILSTTYAESVKSGGKFAVERPKSAHYMLLRGGSLNDKPFVEYRKIAMDRVDAAIKTGQFTLFDGRGANHTSILNAIAQYAKPDTLILLDYIQKVPPPPDGATDTWRRITDISASIVNATVKANAITISGAQFNRVSGKDDSGADNFDDCSFRESGDLEQDAENAIGIGWEANHQDRFFRVIKCRHGENGAEYKIDYQGAYSYMAIGDRREKSPKPKKQGKKEIEFDGTKRKDHSDPRQGWV